VQISPYHNTGQFFNQNAFTGVAQPMYTMQQGQAPLISQPLHHTLQTPMLQQPAVQAPVQYHGHPAAFTQVPPSVVSYCSMHNKFTQDGMSQLLFRHFFAFDLLRIPTEILSLVVYAIPSGIQSPKPYSYPNTIHACKRDRQEHTKAEGSAHHTSFESNLRGQRVPDSGEKDPIDSLSSTQKMTAAKKTGGGN
jgi:hypothetical protein